MTIITIRCPEAERLNADIDAAIVNLRTVTRQGPTDAARGVVYAAIRAYFYHRNGSAYDNPCPHCRRVKG